MVKLTNKSSADCPLKFNNGKVSFSDIKKNPGNYTVNGTKLHYNNTNDCNGKGYFSTNPNSRKKDNLDELSLY